jgi:hypothetical protein
MPAGRWATVRQPHEAAVRVHACRIARLMQKQRDAAGLVTFDRDIRAMLPQHAAGPFGAHASNPPHRAAHR